MRRALMRFLPVFWLALIVQILAPVGVCLARSAVAADPLSGAILCQGSATDHASGQDQPHRLRDGACSACAVAQTPAPPSPEPKLVLCDVQVSRVVWRAFAPEARASKLASHAQARAPPVLS
jgi:hypothetical protein